MYIISLHYTSAMSQRVKRPNRSDDGSVPTKRRKVSWTLSYKHRLGCLYMYFVTGGRYIRGVGMNKTNCRREMI